MMRLEVVRIVADALLNSTYGVNALLPTIPRDAGDLVPEPVAAVYDETRHSWVAAKTMPPKRPCLIVMMEGDITVAGAQLTDTYRDTSGSTWITVRYLTTKHNTEKGLVESDYTLRAVARSMLNLMEQPNDAPRTRNSIMVVNLKSIRYVPARESAGDAGVVGAVLLEFDRVRDGAPLTGG